MPGYGLPHVKCEPPSESDEDDSNSQFTQNFGTHQVPSTRQTELRAIKIDPDSTSPPNHHVPTSFMQHLEAPSLEELGGGAPAAPSATPVCVKQEPPDGAPRSLETLEPAAHTSAAALELSLISSEEIQSEFMPLMVKDEPGSEGEQHHLSGSDTSDSCGADATRSSPKSWTQSDMDNALSALRTHNMSLTKASATYGIPSTTLWQRAHRLGIDTPKKEGTSKSWSEADLRGALQALRAGAISANKASKAYGIPSSTLYKIARREGIRLAAPFNAAPTSWRPSDLERALQAIRCGHASVQRASAQFGIPTGTLYGRCKREGIELSRSNPTPWSEDAMGEALEAVRVGQMSINQAAIHYNLPYSSLYGRFKRCKYPQSPQQSQQPIPDQEPSAPPPTTYQQYPPAGPPEHPHYHQHHIPTMVEHSHVPQHELMEAHDPSLLAYHQPDSSDHQHQQQFNAMYYGQSIATS